MELQWSLEQDFKRFNFLSFSPFHLVALKETKLSASISLLFPGYCVVISDRSSSRSFTSSGLGGSVTFLVHDDVPYTVLSTSNFDFDPHSDFFLYLCLISQRLLSSYSLI